MSDKHIKYLADLCRICGEKLAKSKGYKESSYLCSSNVQFIQDNFGISVEKDVEEVHPPCFCKKCRLTNSRTPVFWEPHQEEECKTCNLATVVKKGGRPSKPKRGRGKSTAAATQKRQAESEVVDFCKTVDNLVENLPSSRVADFGEKFNFDGEVQREYFCPVCIDILDRPIETDCEHYFCSDCIKGVVTTSGSLACPMCKEESLNSVRVLTRMVLNFIKDLPVVCKTCGQKTNYENCANHICTNQLTHDQTRPGAPLAGLLRQPEPVPENRQKTVEELEQEIREGKLTPEAERLGSLFVKAKLGSSTDGKTVTLKTGGKSLDLRHVPRAQKPSSEVSSRHLLRRTRYLESVGASVSQGQMDVHVVHGLRLRAKQEREALLREALGKELILELPEGQTLAMKADLSMSWFKLNKLRRWFKKWGIKMESEKKQRLQKTSQLQADSLLDEMIPMEHTEKRDNKQFTVIKPTPAAYVVDLKEKVMSFMDKCDKANILTWHDGVIPAENVYLKLGGDHGQGSMKMAFQIANVPKPNSPQNTIIFALFEGKDTRNNLATILNKYQEQLQDLKSTTWREKTFVSFLFGDYEFLCKVMGISGSSARHCCLWCTIVYAEMALPKEERSTYFLRTLDHLKQQFKEFQEKGQGDIKKAKTFLNVIASPMLEIELDQICIPGLHISLGVFLKFYELLLSECAELDEKIAYKLAEDSSELGDSRLDELIKNLREAKQHETAAATYFTEAKSTEEYACYVANWIAITNQMDNPNPLIQQLLEHSHMLKQKAEKEVKAASQIKSKCKFTRDMGKIHSALEDFLQKINVKRQAYHSNSFVGNHINICLKKENIRGLCRTVTEVTTNISPTLATEATQVQEKFEKLFTLFAECHFKINSSKAMDDEALDKLENDIKNLMTYFRTNFKAATFPPKMHMLEEHAVQFIRRWKFPLGFFGEQGGESIHHEFVGLSTQFLQVKPDSSRLKKMLEEHYVKTNPLNRTLLAL